MFSGNIRRLVLLIGFAVTIPAILSCGSKTGQEQADKLQTYADSLNAMRSEKDTYLRESEDSPIPEEDRRTFGGLNYFAADSTYRIVARLVPFEKQDTIEMLTSKKNRTRKMLRYGTFDFKLNGSDCKLTTYIILPVEDVKSFFLPFIDSTTGNESYYGGRYLDIEEHSGNDLYTIDFNLAYSPYCAYNDKYSCPIVPRENTLQTAIKAGEKKYHDD